MRSEKRRKDTCVHNIDLLLLSEVIGHKAEVAQEVHEQVRVT